MQEHLLTAVCNHLRARLDLPAEAVRVMFDGRPAPSHGGKVFVAVCEGDWRADESIGSSSLMLPEAMGFEVVVTVKCGDVPFDRLGTDVLARERAGLAAICRKVVVAAHMSYPIMAATAAAVGTDQDSQHKPAAFKYAEKSRPQGPGWFGAKGTKSNPPCGLSRTLVFGEAQSVQRLGELR